MDHTRALSAPIVLSACLLAAAGPARADDVVVLHVRGTLPIERLVELEEETIAAIEGAGHRAFTERGALEASDAERPETANELRAVAEMQGATYVVDPRFAPGGPGSVRATLRVGYAPETRVEELELDLPADDPAPLLREALGLLLRPEGAGEDAADRLAAAQAGRDAAAADAARLAAEAEEARRREEAAAARRAEEAARAAEDAADDAPPYAAGRPWLLSAGFAARPIIDHPDQALGGTLGTFELQAGRHFAGVQGLEARLGAEIYFGAANGFALTGGAVYMLQPFGDLPLFLGPGVDVGWFQGTSGAREAALLLRAKPVIAFRPTDALQIEASLPEIQWLSTDGGSTVLGFAARVGWRF